MAEKATTKTGECYYRDENGWLWLAETFANENDNVTTERTKIQEDAPLGSDDGSSLTA